jgi:hypothetical protein
MPYWGPVEDLSTRRRPVTGDFDRGCCAANLWLPGPCSTSPATHRNLLGVGGLAARGIALRIDLLLELGRELVVELLVRRRRHCARGGRGGQPLASCCELHLQSRHGLVAALTHPS